MSRDYNTKVKQSKVMCSIQCAHWRSSSARLLFQTVQVTENLCHAVLLFLTWQLPLQSWEAQNLQAGAKQT
jgi:hypothetical protein